MRILVAIANGGSVPEPNEAVCVGIIRSSYVVMWLGDCAHEEGRMAR